MQNRDETIESCRAEESFCGVSVGNGDCRSGIDGDESIPYYVFWNHTKSCDGVLVVFVASGAAVCLFGRKTRGVSFYEKDGFNFREE